MKLLKNISSLVTVNANGDLYKIKEKMNEIGEIKNASLLFSDKIEWIGNSNQINKIILKYNLNDSDIIDASNKTIMPGFVDSHSHIVFAGNRTNEFARRLRGATYQEIAEEGGGIQTTVKATRAASIEELYENGKKLALSAIKYGTTAIEIKSGYSLTLEGELNQLRAIKLLSEELPIDITSTFLGAHDFPIEYKNNHSKYIDIICNEMIPQIAEEGLAKYCDAFIDKGYYTIEEGRKVLECGLKHGLKSKIHCDELADVSATKLAAELGAISADHLLCVSNENIKAIAESGTVAGLLPGTAYFIRMPYAPARKIINEGVITAIATDCNPGSSFTENMQTILSLSVINMGMTAEEAIVASTLNAAHSIEKSNRMGSLELGKDANFIILDTPNYSDLFYHFGINHVEETWIFGKKIK